MAKYENFYESIQEAIMRIRGTVVLYDGLPFSVWAVTDHKGDGVFRVYMSPVEDIDYTPSGNPVQSVPHGHSSMGPMLDTWMETPNVKNNPAFHIFRKKMNSPLFNKFRPFSLGMMNSPHFAMYLERQPQRPKTEQGLVSGAIFSTCILASRNPGHTPVNMYTKAFRDCVVGDYPTPKKVLEGLKNPKNANESVAFHRKFALIRGPIDILFLGYKDETIGVLPHGDFSKVRLGKDFKHYIEVVDELRLFADIM